MHVPVVLVMPLVQADAGLGKHDLNAECSRYVCACLHFTEAFIKAVPAAEENGRLRAQAAR